MSTPARVAQNLQLIDGGGAEGVGGADERPVPLAAEAMRQLADGGGLAGAVHADDQHDARRRGWYHHRTLRPGEHRAQFLDHSGAKPGAPRRAAGDSLEDPGCRRHPDVGAEQQLLERLRGLDVDAFADPPGALGPADDRLELLCETLGRARQTLRELLEQTHQADLAGHRRLGRPVSARCRIRPAAAVP